MALHIGTIYIFHCLSDGQGALLSRLVARSMEHLMASAIRGRSSSLIRWVASRTPQVNTESKYSSPVKAWPRPPLPLAGKRAAPSTP